MQPDIITIALRPLWARNAAILAAVEEMQPVLPTRPPLEVRR